MFLQICRNTMQFSHLPRKHKVVHHHVSVSRDLYLCRYSHVIIMSLHILPPFSVYGKSATSSSWGYPFFARAKQTLRLHKTFNQCCFNVRRASPSLAHHLETNSSNNFHSVCWIHSQRHRLSWRCR